mmetsp:Transcript_29788/g.30214  ORF Transcript_29788/g.30214 Transcript_29788/m.30214 type:complete len:288 (-) Transcript_29788:214-1077(-)
MSRATSPALLRHRHKAAMQSSDPESQHAETDEFEKLGDRSVHKLLDQNAALESTVNSLRTQVDNLKSREKKLMSALQSSQDAFVLDDKTGTDGPIVEGGCPIEPRMTFWGSLKDRSGWLIGLLIFQSCSSFILEANEELLKAHPVIIFFLTMLVGAGGNAGNQSAVRVIRGIAVGSITKKTYWQFLSREIRMALSLSCILGGAGLVRALVSGVGSVETVTITVALMSIVFISVVTGAMLPMLLQAMDIDPAHSSTTIQVIMDILGVLITCAVSTLLLDRMRLNNLFG